MFPSQAADCLLHCRDRMTPDDYRRAIEYIELLVAAERFDAVERAAQTERTASERRLAAIHYTPPSAEEIAP